MEDNKNTDQTKKQDKQEIPQDANKDKTTQDFTGYPHYPANEEMLKHGEKENLSDQLYKLIPGQRLCHQNPDPRQQRKGQCQPRGL